jgi:hypothetical protein
MKNVKQQRGRRVGHNLNVSRQTLRGTGKHVCGEGQFSGLGFEHSLIVELNDLANAFGDQILGAGT